MLGTGSKLSEYHRIEGEDHTKLVYDIDSVTVYEVDDAIWDFYLFAEDPDIPCAERALARKLGPEAAAEVKADLESMGLLESADAPTPERPAPRSSGMTGVTLNVTHGCNLACTYCYASQGDYGLGRSRMSAETARAALDWLAERSTGEHPMSIGFFGGEPLMNVPTIRAAIEHGGRYTEEGRRMRYHITTNGTLLTEDNVQLIADHDIQVQVSMDGVPEVQDRLRPFASGQGSHEAVVEGIRRLKRVTGRAPLRGTIPADRPEFGDNLHHMVSELGATHAAFEPAESSEPDGVGDAETMERIKREWSRLAEEFAEAAERGELLPYSNLLRRLYVIHTRKKSVYGCAAGHGNVAIDPSGDIYPCHRFVGEEEWSMGNVHDGSFDPSIRRRFEQNTVDQRTACSTCWARYICGGRCVHEAKEATGSIREADALLCDMVRFQTELCLLLYARLRPHQRAIIERIGTDLKPT